MNGYSNHAEANKTNIPTISFMLNDGQTMTPTLLRDVTDIHISTHPDRPEVRILDPTGKVIPTPRTTLMARLDTKVQESVTLTKGTLWLLGAVVVILNLSVLFGGSLISWARSDQSQVEKQIQMQSDMKRLGDSQDRMEQRFEKLDDRLQQQEKLNERTRGYQLGQTDAGATGHKQQ